MNATSSMGFLLGIKRKAKEMKELQTVL